MKLLPSFISKNDCNIRIRSCAIDVDFSYSEGVVCVRSESTSNEGSVHRIHLTRDHSPTLFQEYHCVVSDLPLRSMHSIVLQDTLTLLEVVDGVTSRGGLVGATRINDMRHALAVCINIGIPDLNIVIMLAYSHLKLM